MFKRSVYTHLHQRAITEGRKMGRVVEIRRLDQFKATVSPDVGINFVIVLQNVMIRLNLI